MTSRVGNSKEQHSSLQNRALFLLHFFYPYQAEYYCRRPKILQNNSKGAAKNRKIGGRMDPNFDQKWQKRGRNIFSNYFQFIQGQFGQKDNFQCFEFGLIIKIFLSEPLKNTDMTMQNFFFALYCRTFISNQQRKLGETGGDW